MGRLSQFIWCGLACTPTSVPGSRIVFILSRGCLEEEIKIKKRREFFASEGRSEWRRTRLALYHFFSLATFSHFWQPIFAIVSRRHSKPKPRVRVSLNRSQLRPDPTATERFSKSRYNTLTFTSTFAPSQPSSSNYRLSADISFSCYRIERLNHTLEQF